MNRDLNRPIELLLVDDNSSDVRLIEEALQTCALPHRLRAVSGITEALELIRCKGSYHGEVRPDLMILDIQLTNELGLDLLKVIKKDEKLKVIPVIVMSSSQAESDILESYRHHANSYIVKPILFQELEQLMINLMNFWFETAVLTKP